MTMLGLCCGLIAIRFGFERRFELAADADPGGRGDRRAGRAAGPAAEGDIPLRCGIRQPVGFPVLRRGTRDGAVSLDDARLPLARLRTLPAVRGVHGAAAGAVQRGARCRAVRQAGLHLQLLHRRPGTGRAAAACCSRCSSGCGSTRWNGRRWPPWCATRRSSAR